MSRRAKHEDIGPSAHDFEAAVVKVFGDYPDALLVLPENLEEEAHQKIKARFPKAKRVEVECAIWSNAGAGAIVALRCRKVHGRRMEPMRSCTN